MALPIPFQYFHLLSMMIIINLGLWAFAMGLTASWFAPVVYVFCSGTFIGMLQLASQLSDPFGNDAVDFDLHGWIRGAHVSAVYHFGDRGRSGPLQEARASTERRGGGGRERSRGQSSFASHASGGGGRHAGARVRARARRPGGRAQRVAPRRRVRAAGGRARSVRRRSRRTGRCTCGVQGFLAPRCISSPSGGSSFLFSGNDVLGDGGVWRRCRWRSVLHSMSPVLRSLAAVCVCVREGRAPHDVGFRRSPEHSKRDFASRPPSTILPQSATTSPLY